MNYFLFYTGRLTSSFLDDLNICRTANATERDELTWCRQHAFIVTHVDTNARHQAAAQKKLDDANPVIIEERRQRLDDAKRVAREDARMMKEAATSLAKSIEKNRKASLTREELAAENLVTNNAKAVKKAAKLVKAAEDAADLLLRRARISAGNNSIDA